MIIKYFVCKLPTITNDATESVTTGSNTTDSVATDSNATDSVVINSNVTDSVATDSNSTDKPLVCINYCSAAPSLNSNNCKQRNSSLID